MKHLCRAATRLVAAIFAQLSFLASAHAQAGTPAPGASHPSAEHRETVVATRATGTFEVKLAPLPPYDTTEGAMLGRMSIDKQFHGDLEATSKGEMLSAGTAVQGSAAYVAIERVTGRLNGRSGTFVLQHRAVMNRGAPELSVTVVPDSGTGELTGLSGTMMIIIANGQHSYELDYTLPAAH